MIYGVSQNSQLPMQTLVGLRETVSALAIVLGPTCAALLMNFLDARTVLWVTAVTSLIAAILCALIPKSYNTNDDSELSSSKVTYWGSFIAGITFLAQHKNAVLRKLTSLNVASIALVSVLQSLLLPVVMTLAGAGAANGYALAAIGLGLLLGGLLYALLGTRVSAWPMTVLASIFNIVGLVLLVQFYSVAYVIVMCFVFGVTSALVGATTGVVSLQVTPERMRGRINGLQNSIAMLVGPLGIFVVALLISKSSVHSAGWLLAAFWLLANLVIFMNSGVRQAIKNSQNSQ